MILCLVLIVLMKYVVRLCTVDRHYSKSRKRSLDQLSCTCRSCADSHKRLRSATFRMETVKNDSRDDRSFLNTYFHHFNSRLTAVNTFHVNHKVCVFNRSDLPSPSLPTAHARSSLGCNEPTGAVGAWLRGRYRKSTSNGDSISSTAASS